VTVVGADDPGVGTVVSKSRRGGLLSVLCQVKEKAEVGGKGGEGGTRDVFGSMSGKSGPTKERCGKGWGF